MRNYLIPEATGVMESGNTYLSSVSYAAKDESANDALLECM